MVESSLVFAHLVHVADRVAGRLIALVGAVLYGLFRVPAPPASVVEATSASRVLWRTLVEPLLPYLVFLVVLMCLACAAVGVALNYVLLERAEQRQ